MKLAVFGHPVSHSLSPEIHRSFAAQFGLDLQYDAIDAAPESFPDALGAFAKAGATGCNITLPLKTLAWEAAGRSSDEADRARAANTLVFESFSNWFADNTDGRGLVRDLKRLLPGGPADRRILLLGAGGAAAGVLGPLLQAGATAVHIANRTPERARSLAEHHADLGTVRWSGLAEALSPDEAPAAPYDLVIQSTSAGHAGKGPQLTPDLFAPGALCYDLNYGAASSALARWCADHEVMHADGLGMLVEQAGLSFALWTGHTPDCRTVLKALRSKVGTPGS
ncbi:shikimate dehydrogenase [Elongatibacter sediminis]|uniref:shikimate dehydrogenase (NADP(+)) n=1 Tax=Elongatibacter sediminis TaxID=3119006 RepID=A0AAW9RJD3_9GAMM